ncbi:hypothetical protein MicloDRAFT_00018760 [Microvirga lotononidis]|uniref:Uncharacterized protein n=1 Tax=Microvirga lotononidis TaxID=864069 RepID=I4YZL0_9HYPH|nr:hypothetical protein MicloDRAFT_00018760 [Microvirga lotononidis]
MSDAKVGHRHSEIYGYPLVGSIPCKPSRQSCRDNDRGWSMPHASLPLFLWTGMVPVRAAILGAET